MTGMSMAEHMEIEGLRLQERIRSLQDNPVYDRVTNAALLSYSKVQLQGMQKALERVNGGTYGLCQACGGRIETERLEILPYTTTCSVCAH